MITFHLAALRHSRYFANLLLRADELYQEGEIHVVEGLRLFDENQKNIELGQKWASVHAETIEDAATLALEYPDRGANCLYLRQKPLERIRWLRTALEIAHARGYGRAEASLLGKIGLAFQDLRQFSEAIEYHSTQLNLAEKLNDQEIWAEAACNLGIAYDDLNILETAQEWYLAAAKISETTSNLRVKERVYGNLGMVYLKLEKYSEAIQRFKEHLKLACEHGDLWSEGNALTNLGIAEYKLHKYELADAFFQKSLSINWKLKDLEGEARNWSYIGLLRKQSGDLDGAVTAFQTRISLAQKMGDLRGESLGCWNLGEVLIRKKMCKEGIAFLYKCIEYEKEVGDPSWEEDQKAVRHMEELCIEQTV